MTWDATQEDYIKRQGWKLDADGTLVLTSKQYAKYSYTGRSILDSNVRTLMLASSRGCCLIFEGKHFRVDK